MKILHVDMGRYLDGGARQVADLLNGLEKFPDEHSLVCPSGAELIGEIRNRSVRINRIIAADEKGFKFVTRLRKIIRYEKPDLLHIHSRPGDGWAILAGSQEKKPMVYSRRTDAKPGLLARYVKLRRFKKIIALSRSIRQALLDAHIPADQIVHIPVAVDTERFKPERVGRETFLAQFGLRGDGPVLAVVAEMVRTKGHSVFFAALPPVLAKYPALRVLIFGRGPAKDELQRELIRRKLDKYVRVEGFRNDMETILPHVDMLIHPALEEGVGVPVLEAAACGVPIVASRVGGIPDIVQDRFNGYLVTAGDNVAIARHILALLDDPDLLHQFGKTARELAVEKFSIERMVAGYREVYREVDWGS